MKSLSKKHHPYCSIYFLLTMVLLLFLQHLTAQNVGDVREFGPVRIHLDANWQNCKGQQKNKTEIFNTFPPGYVIIGNRTHKHSINNGSYTVSTIAGGSNYIEKHEIVQVYNNYIDLAIKAGQHQLVAKLKQELQQYLNTYSQYQSTHNTLRVWAEAHTAGHCFDRVGGWVKMDVYPKAMYIGDPDPKVLFKKLENKYPLPVTVTVTTTATTATEVGHTQSEFTPIQLTEEVAPTSAGEEKMTPLRIKPRRNN